MVMKKKNIQYKYDKTSDHYDIRYNLIQNTKITAIFDELIKMNELNNGKYILDFGCGTCSILEKLNAYISERFYYIGIDFSIGMIKYGLDKNIPNLTNKNNISLILADAENIPLKNNLFDLIISLTVIQNLPEPANHLNEIMSKLKKNSGNILISFHKKIFTKELIENLLKKHPNLTTTKLVVDEIEDYLYILSNT
jgi:ubiquinone/menaquinone biosynthesis C-methylase UbiE